MRKQLVPRPFNREKPLQSLFWRSASLLLGRACQRFWASSPPLERLAPSRRLAVERNSGLGVRGREGGAHPSRSIEESL